jgi:BirA family biotin operon repressor/biotin-[acetyl-CoA-carboxylase] ligase
MTIWLTESVLPSDPTWTLKMAWILLGYLSEFGSSGFLKYPNDIHLSSESGKIAGILVECLNNGYLIGLGINRFSPEEVKNAAGWEALPDHHAMALSLSRRIRNQFLGSKKVPSDVIMGDLNRRLLWKGEWVAWKETGSASLSLGKIVRLDGTGRLEISDPDGRSRYLPETVHAVRRVDPAEKIRP